MPLRLLFVLVSLVDISACADSGRFFPVLLWHSAGNNLIKARRFDFISFSILGETCCGKEGNRYANFIENELSRDVTVRSVKLGNTEEDDFTYSLSTHPFDQVR